MLNQDSPLIRRMVRNQIKHDIVRYAMQNDLAFLQVLAAIRDAKEELEEELKRRRGGHLQLVRGDGQ
jgi:hypothetical protein